jgi:serine/threonine protein kinase
MMMIDNPNIVKLYEVFEGEYHIYLVMELLNGN